MGWSTASDAGSKSRQQTKTTSLSPSVIHTVTMQKPDEKIVKERLKQLLAS